MGLEKTLASFVFMGGFVLGAGGCTNYSKQYAWDGKIGEEEVQFSTLSDVKFTDSKWYTNIITVTKSNGREVRYIDGENNDLLVDSVDIRTDGVAVPYDSTNPILKPFFEQAQIQFDDYLVKIKEAKLVRGLEGLH